MSWEASSECLFNLMNNHTLWLERRAEATAVEPAPAPTPALQSLGPSTAGAPEQEPEQRLPVSGYMDFHFNKERSEPGQLDFHRFVLLFGHSFSERIKFWSELE